MKTNIKMRVTLEQSIKIQEICFENGIIWAHKVRQLTNLHLPFLVICKKKGIYATLDIECYNSHTEYQEIDADLFIRTNGTCEENTFNELFEKVSERVNDFQIGNRIEPIDKYRELEQKLKKKNEILKKTRIKRKNQREELHKLNLKLQKCISFEEHNRKIESIEFDLNMFKSSNKLREDLIEKLERDAKESIKDIKELESLNNVLKMENKSLKESSKISCNMLHSQKDKIDRLELNYVIEQSSHKKEIEKLKAVIEYLESKAK